MKTFPFRVANEPVHIYVIETDDDLREALEYIDNSTPYTLSIDTETTGLDIFSPTFRIRTLQVGDGNAAYVLPLRSVRDARAREMLERSIRRGVSLHNASFDLVALDVTGLMSLAESEEHYHDTKILAHLIDPRGKMDGGVGFGLKELSAKYVDRDAPDTQKDLKEEFRKIGATLATGWQMIDINNPTYLLYAGLDVILTSRLHARLRDMVNAEGYGKLARFEHEVARVTNRMKKRGFRIDADFTETLIDRLKVQEQQGKLRARQLGLENMNSTKQVSAAFQALGWQPIEFTRTGNPKVDKSVLETIAEDGLVFEPKQRFEDVNGRYELAWQEEQPSEFQANSKSAQELAQHILSSKSAAKWNVAYAQAMYDARDSHDHVHPDINALQARTGRMSISNPPLQQLPSRGDNAWVIRRQVIADEGYVIGSADYDQIEFRVLAGLADIAQMKYAIANDIDLHDYTAQLVYGDGFTKHQRSIGKGVGFGKVFGGGARTLSRQTGAPIDAVREAIAAYDNAYPELPRFAKSLQREQRQRGGYIVNYHGRYLPLDVGREYAAVNYSVQSIARDILAQALIDLATAGLDDYLLLPVHDEVLWQAPREDAHDVAREVGRVMSGVFIDVPITASGEVYGKSWAQGYVYTDAHGVVRSKGTKNPIKGWIEP